MVRLPVFSCSHSPDLRPVQVTLQALLVRSLHVILSRDLTFGGVHMSAELGCQGTGNNNGLFFCGRSQEHWSHHLHTVSVHACNESLSDRSLHPASYV